MASFGKLVVWAVSSVLAFFVGVVISSPKASDINSALEKELGENFKKESINKIYIAGPNKTVSCS